jgi:hypothetical protein
LAQERVAAVITALTEGAVVSTKRLHVATERVRGRGAPEVQYVIQAGEEQQGGGREAESGKRKK